MADKFRITFPVPVVFSDGELPTSTKLSAIASQARVGQSLIEYALGDLWNSAGDPVLTSASLTENALMIPNLARYLGASKQLSPYIPQVEVTAYTFAFQQYSGLREAVLTFPPQTGAVTYTWTGTGTPNAVPEASLAAVKLSGQWYVHQPSGWCYFYDQIGVDWKITYRPIVYGDYGTNDFSFNVIPDPDTDASYAFQGLKIQYINGVDNTNGYYIFLPPRGPLSTRVNTKWPQDDVHVPTAVENLDTTPTAGDYLFFQSDTVAATTATGYAEHYRYALPKQLTDAWDSGTRVPDGYLYLWDPVGTGTILDGITFYATVEATPKTWALVAIGNGLDNYLATTTGLMQYPAASLQSTSHAASLYPAGGLKLIVSGSDFSRTLRTLYNAFLNHDHSPAATPALTPNMPVKHERLMNLFGAGASPAFEPSGLPFDDHPQYLHRRGLQATRDTFSGGMLGDIFMCSTGSAGVYDEMTQPSNRIRFGSSVDGPTIHYTGTGGSNQLLIDQAEGLALNTTNASYYQGAQNHPIWIDLYSSGSSAAGANLWYWHRNGVGGDLCWESLAGGSLWFEITDYPEGCTIEQIDIDWEGAGGAGQNDMYFFKVSWGNPHTWADMEDVGTNNFINGPVLAARTISTFWPFINRSLTHATDKLVLQWITDVAACKLYGVRLTCSYTSVCKWTPF